MPKEDVDVLIKKHKLLSFAKILLIVLVAAGVLWFLYFRYINMQYSNLAQGTIVSRQAIAGTTDVIIGESLITYSSDGASCMDTKGNAIWNQTFEMQNPMEADCGNIVAFADYNGRKVYVMNNEKILGEVTTNMPIRKLGVTSNGVVMTVQEESKITWIYLYDSNGKELAYFSTRMNNTGYPTAIGLSPDSKLVCVGYTYPDSGSLKTRVAFYNFGDVGENEIDHLVSVYNYSDTFVPYVKFMNASTAFAVSDNRFMVYRGSEVPEVSKETFLDNDVLSVYNSDEYIGLVTYNDDTEYPYVLNIYNSFGNMESSIPLPFSGVTDARIVINDKTVLVYNENKCCIYNISGRLKYQGTFDSGIRVMAPISGKYKFLIVTQDSLYTAELK